MTQFSLSIRQEGEKTTCDYKTKNENNNPTEHFLRNLYEALCYK